MGYEGGRLAPVFDSFPATWASRRMADAGAKRFREAVVQNTPIDDSPFPSRPPGTARRSWREKPVVGPVRTLSGETYETGIESDDKVLSFLETGTGLYGPKHRAYWIFPKQPGGRLHFYSRKTGQWVFANAVLHPGIHAQRPLATGAAIVEHTLAALLQPQLLEWKAAQEYLFVIESSRSRV